MVNQATKKTLAIKINSRNRLCHINNVSRYNEHSFALLGYSPARNGRKRLRKRKKCCHAMHQREVAIMLCDRSFVQNYEARRIIQECKPCSLLIAKIEFHVLSHATFSSYRATFLFSFFFLINLFT